MGPLLALLFALHLHPILISNFPCSLFNGFGGGAGDTSFTTCSVSILATFYFWPPWKLYGVPAHVLPLGVEGCDVGKGNLGCGGLCNHIHLLFNP